MTDISSTFDKDAFVASMGGYYVRDFQAYWVHMDHKPIMVAAGFNPVMVKDTIHGGQKQAMGGVGHYWWSA